MTEEAAPGAAGTDARQWVVRWMYAAALAHLLAGMMLAWLGDSAAFDFYHRAVEQRFWSGTAPAEARAQQVWWIQLFGASIQNLAIWMLALVHIGNRLKLRAAWGWLLAGLLVWAPQDMLISAHAHVWLHVGVDVVALLVMVPSLLWLWNKDSP